MELKGEQRIEAPREKVWAALNDPDVLKTCIPGCEELTRSGENGFDAVVVAKVGPVKAKFKGNVELSNINPPESYTISGEGKGGAAGMAKGSADVVLEADGDATILKYAVKADVGGKLAQMGSRLIQSTANKYARDFFAKFGDVVTGDSPLDGTDGAEPEASATATPATAGPSAGASRMRYLVWVLVAVIAGLLVYFLN